MHILHNINILLFSIIETKKEGQNTIELISIEHTKLQAMANEHTSKKRKFEQTVEPVDEPSRTELKDKEDKKLKKANDNDIMVKSINKKNCKNYILFLSVSSVNAVYKRTREQKSRRRNF